MGTASSRAALVPRHSAVGPSLGESALLFATQSRTKAPNTWQQMY